MAIRSDALTAKLSHLYPLSADEEEVLQNAFSRVEDFARDRDIVREGTKPTQCSLLLDGFVFRYKVLPDGKRQILSFQVPGDVFDTQTYLLDTMDHTVAALTPCRIAILRHDVMREITERFPRITRALWKETLVEAAILREWLTSAGRRSAFQRIAHLICEVFVRQRAVGRTRGLEMDWPITQVEIGDALGLTHVHINRTLQELRRDGLIRLGGGTLEVLDWRGLMKGGQFDPSYLQLVHVDLP
ncbi:MAG: helix-turn-helix domain-containing protein [Alphaproteobacteria bacterium]|nr:helix-turn-helix domain-containing protein [Alphaproteobacteria bacterium]